LKALKAGKLKKIKKITALLYNNIFQKNLC